MIWEYPLMSSFPFWKVKTRFTGYNSNYASRIELTLCVKVTILFYVWRKAIIENIYRNTCPHDSLFYPSCDSKNEARSDTHPWVHRFLNTSVCFPTTFLWVFRWRVHKCWQVFGGMLYKVKRKNEPSFPTSLALFSQSGEKIQLDCFSNSPVPKN